MITPGTNFSQLTAHHARYLGTIGYLAIFVYSLGAVMIAPAQRILWVAGASMVIAMWAYPQVFRSLMRLRWLVMIFMLAFPPIFLVGETDRSLAGIAYSSEGLQSAIQIAVRIVVVLVAIQGFTSSVDVSALAGLLERVGLRGLGFSFGVALNLLPSLTQAAQNAWRTLWMRGGLRKKRWHGLRLLAMNILVGALSRAEEIALAAEARAFSPDRARGLPLKHGRYDLITFVLGGVSVLCLVLVPWSK